MKIIVIGLGSMGKRRIRLLQQRYPEIVISGVDSNPDRCNEVQEQYLIKCYLDLNSVKKETEINCAFVCTSPLSHGNIIKKCLENGWNVFSEINLVSDLYEENLNLAKEKELTLFLSSTPIYRDEMKIIHTMVSRNDNCVNYIYHVGQYLPDWHPWENIEDYFVSSVRTNGCRELFAIELPWMIQTFGKISETSVISGNLSDLQIGYKDNFMIQVIHENGNKGILCIDVVCRQAVRKLEIYNETLYIEWNGKPETLKCKNLQTGKMEQICLAEYKNELGYSQFVNEYAYLNEIEEFMKVLNGKESQYGFEEDKETLSLIDRIGA